jgi:type VII secretion-associated serine protease mycosin
VAACLLIAGLFPTAPAAADTAAAPLPGQQQGCLSPPPTSDTAVPWAQQQLAPQRVWPLTAGGGVTVAVVDTGVDAGSPQLAGHVLPGADVLNSPGGPANTDCFGHGTFVAGIIAAAPAPGTGFAGVAPDAMILPVRVANSADDVTAGSIAKGIRAAVDAGVSVINVSASTTVVDPNLEAAVRYAESRDVVVVASAANSADKGDPVTYPASYPTVLAVGAVDSSGQHASFSQTGPYLGLVAPGVNVVSIGPRGPGQWQGNGTSYAAPFVSAMAALVRSYHPRLTAAQVRHRLEVTADHPAANLPDPQYGWGTANPMAAASAVLPEERTGATAIVGGAPALHPLIPPSDELGPVIAVLSLFVALLLTLVLFLSRRLGPAGQQRRWRRGRIARVLPATQPAPAALIPFRQARHRNPPD